MNESLQLAEDYVRECGIVSLIYDLLVHNMEKCDCIPINVDINGTRWMLKSVRRNSYQYTITAVYCRD